MKNEGAFTLIEMLVALGIFSIVTAGMLPAFTSFLAQNRYAQIKTEAAMAAQQILDEKRVADTSDLPSSGSDAVQTVQVGEHNFEVLVSYCQNPTYCSTSTRHLAVQVSLNSNVIYALETVFTELN